MILAFWSSFSVTLVLFGLAVWTGRRGPRRAHLVIAPTAVAFLAITVLLTEQLGRAVEFPKRELAIHLVFAKTAAGLLVPVIATGLLTVRKPAWRRVHRAFVIVFALDVAIATGTGIWAFSLANPR